MGRSIGWFDAFRENGAPTWYGENRTAVVTDPTTVCIVVIFAIFLAAFLIVLPGIRRERWSSFFSVILTLSVGTILLVCIHHPCWHVGEVRVYGTYRAFKNDKLDAILGVRVGLKHVNITLRNTEGTTSPEKHHLNYNERFYFIEVKSMERELQNGLQKGLPYPILSVIEYLSVDRAGFIWGRQYRLAGYYTCILLWLCFAMWVLQVLMLCLVPQYFSRSLVLVGCCAWLSNLVYVLLVPRRLSIQFSSVDDSVSMLDFRLAWCFWVILGAGAVCILFGLTIRLLEVKAHYYFATFLQTDYDEAASSPARRANGAPDRSHSISMERMPRRPSETSFSIARPRADSVDSNLSQDLALKRRFSFSNITSDPLPESNQLPI